MKYKKYVAKARKFAKSSTGKAIKKWASGYSLSNQDFDFGGIGQSDLGLSSSNYGGLPGYPKRRKYIYAY